MRVMKITKNLMKKIEKNHDVRCSHIDVVKKHQCRKRVIRHDYLNTGFDGKRWSSKYCLEHHREYYFSPSETLSTYCVECPKDSEPIFVMNKLLELLHSKEEGIWRDSADSNISSDFSFCCPKHGGRKERWMKYISRKCITFVRGDCQ